MKTKNNDLAYLHSEGICPDDCKLCIEAGEYYDELDHDTAGPVEKNIMNEIDVYTYTADYVKNYPYSRAYLRP